MQGYQSGLGICSEGDPYGFTVCDLLPKASFGQIIIYSLRSVGMTSGGG